MNTPGAPVIKVAAVDDEADVLSAVADYLGLASDIELVATGASGSEAVEIVRRQTIDVLILDIRMPTMDGVTAAARVREVSPATKVLLFTILDTDFDVRRGMAAGAQGFLLKDSPPEAVIAAVRSVAQGTSVVSAGPLARFFPPPDPSPAALGALSTRELDVLRLLCHGLSNAEIASELVVEESTVKSHVSSILIKLDVSTRMKAVARALRLGAIERT